MYPRRLIRVHDLPLRLLSSLVALQEWSSLAMSSLSQSMLVNDVSLLVQLSISFLRLQAFAARTVYNSDLPA